MQLTTFTDFALRTLMLLAENPDEQFSVRQVSEHYGISRNHLVKVVHKLAQLDYIISTKGKGGGIRIHPKSLQLKLGDLVAQLEPNLNLVECFDRENNTCKITSSCKLKSILFQANKQFVAHLNQYTLADILGTDIVKVLNIK